MTRRLGLASLAVVVLAFAGAAAGPARPLQSLRLVVSVVCPHAPEHVEHETRPIAPPPQPSITAASPRTQPVGLRRFQVERWLFQRPPPAVL